jgi:hypothetical protein
LAQKLYRNDPDNEHTLAGKRAEAIAKVTVVVALLPMPWMTRSTMQTAAVGAKEKRAVAARGATNPDLHLQAVG